MQLLCPSFIWELKCVWVFSQNWESLQPITLAKKDADKENYNHENKNWSCISQALYSKFSIPKSLSKKEKNCYGIRGLTTYRWRQCALITYSTYCFQIKKICIGEFFGMEYEKITNNQICKAIKIINVGSGVIAIKKTISN